MKCFQDNLNVADFKDSYYCNAFVATAIVGSAVIGAGASIIGANKAASAQEHAADTAANTSLSMYNTTRGDLAPYRDIGQTASDKLTNQLDFLTSPIKMDQATLEKTPGYQFTKTQGLKAVQNSAAARGLGVSGAALKGASAFATGLADQTYQNQFNMENVNRTNAYSRLRDLVGVGENASAQTGDAGSKAASTAASAQIGGGNAAAAGYNAIGGAVNNAANNIGGYFAYKGLYGDNGGGSSSVPLPPVDPRPV
jgi:hypothetical protein